MKKNKFKLTDETIQINGYTLYRIKALKYLMLTHKFPFFVRKGQLGGFVEKEDNLSQDGKCWIYNEAKVYGKAKVYNNAQVYGYAQVYGNAWVYGNAQIYGGARVCGDGEIYDYAKVYNNAVIADYAKVFGNAKVFDNAIVYNTAQVFQNAQVYDRASVYNNSEVGGNAKINGEASVFEFAKVDGKCKVVNAEIRGYAELLNNNDYIVFHNTWSSGRYFTWTKSNDMWKVGCFYGTGEELIEKAYKDSEESGKNYEKCVMFVKEHFQTD